MAKIWLVREGPKPTFRDLGWVLPIAECDEKLGLKNGQYLSELSRPPRFEKSTVRADYAGYRHVLCEVGEDEALADGRKPGFYRVSVAPSDAINILGSPERLSDPQ